MRHHLHLARWLELDLAPTDKAALARLVAETDGLGTASLPVVASPCADDPMHAKTETPASGQKNSTEAEPRC